MKLFTALAALTLASTALVGCESYNTNPDGSFKITRGSVSDLALDCRKTEIEPLLKDPSSFREVDFSHTSNSTHINVLVEYTATNSFGGRVRGSKVCRYSL